MTLIRELDKLISNSRKAILLRERIIYGLETRVQKLSSADLASWANCARDISNTYRDLANDLMRLATEAAP